MWDVHQNRILYQGATELWGSRNTCLAKGAGPATGEGCKGQLRVLSHDGHWLLRVTVMPSDGVTAAIPRQWFEG